MLAYTGNYLADLELTFCVPSSAAATVTIPIPGATENDNAKAAATGNNASGSTMLSEKEKAAIEKKR